MHGSQFLGKVKVSLLKRCLLFRGSLKMSSTVLRIYTHQTHARTHALTHTHTHTHTLTKFGKLPHGFPSPLSLLTIHSLLLSLLLLVTLHRLAVGHGSRHQDQVPKVTVGAHPLVSPSLLQLTYTGRMDLYIHRDREYMYTHHTLAKFFVKIDFTLKFENIHDVQTEILYSSVNTNS